MLQEQWKDDFKQEFSQKQYMGRINTAFGADTVEGIIDALKQDSSSWAKEVINDLQKASPLSLKTTFELLKRGKGQNLPECLKMEFRVSQNLLQYDDFFTGVTARKFFTENTLLILILFHFIYRSYHQNK